MSSAGRAASSSGCVARPRAREFGLIGFAAQIQCSSLTGSCVMETAEHREPCESRGSRTDLGAPGGEIPPGDSTIATEPFSAGSGQCPLYPRKRRRAGVSQHGASVNIPPRRNRTEPICFSRHLYRARNLVERFFNKIKQCRRAATRYDKLAANYLAFIQVASIRLWPRVNESAPRHPAEKPAPDLIRVGTGFG